MTNCENGTPILTDRLRDNAISVGVDAITAAMCIDAADYIDALEVDLGKGAFAAKTEQVVGVKALIHQVMQEEWNEICDDTGCHPLDITHGKKSILFFQPNHWADAVAEKVSATLVNELASGLEVTDAIVEAFHKRLMSELFIICQPNRGDIFSFMDDQKSAIRVCLEAALKSEGRK